MEPVRSTRIWLLVIGALVFPWAAGASGLIVEGSPVAGTSPRGSAWDIEAVEVFLRTQSGSGDIVRVPAVGQTVFFHLRFRLEGPAPSTGVSLRARIDGDEICSTSADVGSDQTAVARCTVGWTATAGPHVLEWEAELTDVSEPNTSNNSARRVWNSSTELDVEAITVELRTAANGGELLSAPSPGTEVFFHLRKHDRGMPSEASYRLRAELDGQSYCSGSSMAFDGPSTVWCQVGWVATAGQHRLVWELDTEDALAEVSELNNAAELIWSAQAATATPVDTSTPQPTPTPAATDTPGATSTPTRPQPRFQDPPAIIGDCNRDRLVRINELINGVGIALARTSLASCVAFDENRDFQVSISELVRAVNFALRGAPEFFPPPDVLLQIVPGALLLDAGEDTGALRVVAYESNGTELDAGDFDIEWVSGSPDLLQVTAEPSDSTRASATMLEPLGSAVIVARLREFPQIVSPPANVSRVKLHPEVELIPDDDVVFPPPNLPEGVDLAEVAIADTDTSGSEASFGGFTETELAELLEVLDDFTLRYPAVLRGAPPPVGQRIVAAGGAAIAGIVVAGEQRGDFSLVQLELPALQELFEDIDFSISVEQLLADGLLQPIDTSDWERDEDAAASTSGLFKFSVGPFDCAPPSSTSIRPTFTQSPSATSSYFGPIWDGNLRMRRFTVEEFFVKVGFHARAFYNPELRLTPGVQVQLTCDLAERHRKRQIFPVNGPLALVLAPYLEGLISIPIKANVSSGPTLRFGINVGFDYAYWTGGTYTPATGWQPLCATLAECSRTNQDAQLLWDFDADGDQLTVDGDVSLLGAVDAGVAGAGGLLALIDRLPVSGILGGAVDSVLEKMRVRVLRAKLGPQVTTRWHNAKRTAFLGVSEGAANVTLTGSLAIVFDALDMLLRKVLRLRGVLNIPLLTLTPAHILEPFRVLNEETITVNGERVSRGVSPVPIELRPGPLVPVVATVERDFINLTPIEIFLTRSTPHQEFPHAGELWFDGDPVGLLDPTNDFTLAGSFQLTNAMCEQAESSGTPLEIKILAYNRMFKTIPTANFVGSFFVACVDNLRPVVDAGPDREIEGFTTALAGMVEDDGLPLPPGRLTIDWTASGPGAVTFADRSDPQSQVTFSRDGAYVLTLFADDSELIGQDSVTITVVDNREPTPTQTVGPTRSSTTPPQVTPIATPTPTVGTFSPPEFRRLMGTDTEVPGQDGATFQNWELGNAALVDGVLVFGASFRAGFNTQRGMFVTDGASVQTIVLDNQILPGTEGDNRIRVRTMRNLVFDGTNIAFTAVSGGPGGTNSRHLFRTTVDPGLGGAPPVERLIQGQLLSEQSTSVFSISLRDGMVVGAASGRGIFFLPLSGGSLVPVVDENSAIPGGVGTFRPIGVLTNGGIVGSGPAVVFRGDGDDGQTGIYLAFPNGSVDLIADRSTDHPTATGTFRSFTLAAIDDSDGEVAFLGSANSGLRRDGVFVARDGVIQTVADGSTTAPGTSELFEEIQGSVGFDDDIVVFFASEPNGIFAFAGGALGKVAAPGDTIDGGVVRFATVGSDQTIDEGEVAVGLTFEGDGFDGGIYLASF